MPGTEVSRGSFVVIGELEGNRGIDFTAWHPGPLPLRFGQIGSGQPFAIDRKTRSDYFSARVVDRLYPEGQRFWKVARSDGDVTELRFIEVVYFHEGGSDKASYYVMLHASLTGSALFALTSLVSDVRKSFLNIAVLELIPGAQDQFELELRRTYSLSTALIPAGSKSTIPDIDEWTPPEQVAWALASRWSGSASTAPPQAALDRVDQSGGLIRAKRNVAIVVDRNGAGVAIADSPDADDPFTEWVASRAPKHGSLADFTQLQVHTYFTDCFLLALQQASGLNSIADSFAAISDRRPRLRDLGRIEARYSLFKTRVWRHQVTEESTANELLAVFQRQHGLDDLLGEVDRDLNYLSAQIQTEAAARSGSAVMMLTLVLFPLTIAIAIITSLISPSMGAWEKLLAYLVTIPLSLAIALVITLLIPRYFEFLRDVFRGTSSE